MNVIQNQEGNYYPFKLVQNDSKLIQREINMIQTYFNVINGKLLEIETQFKVIHSIVIKVFHSQARGKLVEIKTRIKVPKRESIVIQI